MASGEGRGGEGRGRFENRSNRVRTAQGKPAKRDFFEKKSGKTWKTQGIFWPFLQPQGNSGNFILPNISDQIGAALRINEASKWINGTHSPLTIIPLFVKLLYLAPWSGLFCCVKPFFHDISHSFFCELQPWEVFENFRYFLQTKDSDNAESISIAKWKEIFGIVIADARQTWTDSCYSYSEVLIIYFDYLTVPFDYLIIGQNRANFYL